MEKLKLTKFNYRKNLPALFDLMQNPEDQMLFSTKCVCNTYEDFELFLRANFQNYYHEFFIIEPENEFGLAGCLYSYDYHPVDQIAKVCVVIGKKYRNSGMGAFATIQFLDYLFKNYNLRKIFSPTYSYNEQSYLSQLDAGMVEEGRFKEYRYFNGKFHDLVILAITKEEFYKRYEGILNDSK